MASDLVSVVLKYLLLKNDMEPEYVRGYIPKRPTSDGDAPRSRACFDIKGTVMLTANKSYKVQDDRLMLVYI